MASLDEYVFGYSNGKVSEADVCMLVNGLMRLDICSSVSANGDFTLKERNKERFCTHFKSKLQYELGETLGIYGFFLNIRKNYGFIIGFIVSALFLLFTSSLVWDVRISGNEILSDYDVEESLRDLGLGIGSRWSKIDNSDIETELLSLNPNIAWISVNRRGTVAYVEIIESENVDKNVAISRGYSNVVADFDGVIEEITVKEGVAAVKVGDVVRSGDILISGIIENEQGVNFCHASGHIRAASSMDITAEIAEKSIRKTVSRSRLAELRVRIFNFSINIFKNYRNSEIECDIIEEIREFALFDSYRLPIRLEMYRIQEYEEVEEILTPDEMTVRAKRLLDSKIYASFRNADVIKLRTSGEFCDGYYRLISRVVYSAEIGKESVIEVN